jgi:meso-butanediol dehydrogenase / (S,S)-butanediol dehydrogenase / diacetyl reductase
MGELDGAVAIVTGASRGIGAGIARVLAREGARVAITAREQRRAQATAREIVDAGGEAIGLPHEVTSAASCAEVVSSVKRALGPVDVLVNNAGVSQRIPFREIDEATWDRMLDVNLEGVYLMTRAVLDDMLDRRGGRIVNIASLASKAGAAPLFSHYVASKFALVGLTQALAAELAPRGVLVNAVCPGVVRTQMWEQELQEVAAEEGVSVERVWSDTLAEIPLARPQQAEDIGHAVAFLASARARNVTGESINVNGGQLMD